MPENLIKKGTTILNNYYKPSEIEVVEHSKIMLKFISLNSPKLMSILNIAQQAGWNEQLKYVVADMWQLILQNP